MRRRSYTYLVVAVALVAGGLASVLIAEASGAASSGKYRASARAGAANRARFTKPLVRYLKRRGFQVNPGYPLLYANDPVERCRDYTYPAWKSCFGANPAAPYVSMVVKSWPNEYVERSIANALGPLRRGYSMTYRLDPREAIVIYGQMPPPGRYFGLQTYEWSQPGHWKAKDYKQWAHDPRRPWPMQYVFSTMPPEHPKSGRTWSFSALGDILNNVVMQRQSGYPFGKNRYFIITPSATTDRAVRRALHAQGIPNRYIFTEQIPSRDKYGPIGPLGMGKNAIDFTTSLRYAVPVSADAASAWRSQLPLTVLRVRAPSSVGPVRRYGALTYERHTGHSEAYLAGDLQNLVKAVCERTSSTTQLQSTDCAQTPPAPYVASALYAGGLGWIGPYCREIHMNCTGDNNDAAIYWGKPLPLDSGQVYAVVDTLATETDNATYVGLSINDASTFSSPVNVLDTGLKGSADGYASTVNNTGKFFVHYFTRDCAPLEPLLAKPQDCSQLTDQDVPPRSDTSALGSPALRGRFMVALRDYIVPGTERGADYSMLLPPRIIAFTKP
jgi:hypothetical protein